MSKKNHKNRNYKNNAAQPEATSGKRKGLWTGLIIAAAIIFIVLICTVVYLCNPYQPDSDALDNLLSDDLITVEQLEDQTVFSPKEATVGFIFYPGANVEHTAYAPLTAWMAREGILCILADMPLNHAFLDSNAADEIMAAHPEITQWYIGGHSLGGAMAAKYAEENADRLEGLVLLAAYSTADLSDTDLKVLSIYGDRDEILNQKHYKKNLSNLPEGYQEIVITGGNHANFGSYGDQKKDGVAIISSYVQSKITAEYLLEFFK